MKSCIALVLFTSLFSRWSFSQDTGVTDSCKAKIIIDAISHLLRIDGLAPNRIYLNIDLRTKKLVSDGMGYAPEMQDTAFVEDSANLNIIVCNLKAQRIDVSCINLPDIGKLNRLALLENILSTNLLRDVLKSSTIYIEVQKPIDGWDVVDILGNNYWRKRYGKSADPALQSMLYLPITYVFHDEKEKLNLQHYLCAYRLDYKKGFPDYKLVGKTLLNIKP